MPTHLFPLPVLHGFPPSVPKVSAQGRSTCSGPAWGLIVNKALFAELQSCVAALYVRAWVVPLIVALSVAPTPGATRGVGSFVPVPKSTFARTPIVHAAVAEVKYGSVQVPLKSETPRTSG